MKTITIIVALVCVLIASCSNEQDRKIADARLKETSIKTTITDFVEKCWNKKDMAVLEAISAENFTRTANDIKVAVNEKEMEATMNIFFTAFPDLNIVVDDIVIKDDQSFAHWTATGTNTGVFGEVPATGKKVKFSGYSIIHFNDAGKLLREDVYFNELELLQQLGYTLNTPALI